MERRYGWAFAVGMHVMACKGCFGVETWLEAVLNFANYGVFSVDQLSRSKILLVE